MRYPLFSLTLLLLPLLSGCTVEAPYHLVVRNVTTVELSSVTVKFGSFRFNFGTLGPDVFASHMFTNEREPLPEAVEISWSTDDGRTVVQTLPVKSKAPPQYTNLYVTFLIALPTAATVQFDEKKRE